MKKYPRLILIFLFSLFFCQLFAQDSTAIQSKKKTKRDPEFKFKSDSINFGEIHQGDSIIIEFKFANTGKTPLVILGAEGSCGCTVAQFPREPILKGEQKIMPVTFYSAGKSGLQEKTVTIYSNAFTNPKVIFIIGNVLVN